MPVILLKFLHMLLNAIKFLKRYYRIAFRISVFSVPVSVLKTILGAAPVIEKTLTIPFTGAES